MMFFAQFLEPGCARAMVRLTRYPVNMHNITNLSIYKPFCPLNNIKGRESHHVFILFDLKIFSTHDDVVECIIFFLNIQNAHKNKAVVLSK